MSGNVDAGRKDSPILSPNGTERTSGNIDEGKKEAVKTYVEQTKLLVTLASAFLFAPPALVGILKDRAVAHITPAQFRWLVGAEVCFIVSVLAGYIVLATIAGWQHKGEFDVYRFATQFWSVVQFFAYLIGLIVFLGLAIALVG
jgi:hypothetical protein